MEQMWREGWYRPWCLFDGDDIAGEVDEAALMAEHRFVYRNTFAPEIYERYVHIPYDPDKGPGERADWRQ